MKRFAALLVLLFGMILGGCWHAPGTSTGQSRADTLIMAHAADAVKLDCADVTDAESPIVTCNIFDGLVRYKDGSTEVEPALATSWELSGDRLTWTFHLRPKVVFQDGTPLDAAAVVFNFERQMFKDNPYHKFGDFEYWSTMWGGYPGILKKVEAVDPMTVRFTLTTPSAPFLANMAMAAFAIASPTAIKKYGAEFAGHPVGTGPFRFVQWQRQERIVLEAFPQCWSGNPAIKKLIFLPIADASSRRLQLERGTIDMARGLNLEDLPGVAKDANLVIARDRGMNFGFMAFNCQKPPFTDVRVRKAICHAIDQAALIKNMYLGYAIPAVNPYPPSVWSYDSDIKPYEYNPDMARKMLAEAGFPNGFETELDHLPVDRDYMPNHQNIAEAIKGYLEAVGIHAALKTYDLATYLDKTAMGQYDMCLLGWVGDNGDPDNFIFVLLDPSNIDAKKGGTNATFYANPKLHEVLLDAQKSADPDERIKLYRQAQEIVHEDAPWDPIAYGDQVAVYRHGLEGFHLHPTGQYRFRDAHWR